MIKRHENLDQLLNQFPIPNFNEDNIDNLEQLNQQSIQAIVDNGGILPAIPPFEKHPYLEELIPDSHITGLMIGTLPPITYLCSNHNLQALNFNNQHFTQPDLDYFHGNYSSLWKYAPIEFDNIQLQPKGEQPNLIATALYNSDIAYTDIIKYAQRKLNDDGKYDASDKNLTSIVPNNQVFDYLFESDHINRLYFTNASFFTVRCNFFKIDGTYNLDDNDAFVLFIKSANEIGVKTEYSLHNGITEWIELNEDFKPALLRRLINNQMRTKTIIKLRIQRNEIIKVYEICSAVSPAAVNRGAHRNPCIVAYGIQNNLVGVEASKGFIRFALSCFFNNTTDELIQYNA